MYKTLNTKEIVLDKKLLKEYLAKLAADSIIKEKSSPDTYPIPRVLDNFEYITLIYTLLNQHVKLGIPIHPAGEWLLDNFYLIENTVKILQKSLSKNKYEKFPRIANGVNAGFARIFVLCNEIVMNTDGRIDERETTEYIQAYQTQKNLYMNEIWNIGIFLQISIIEKIRGICEKIFISQMQKFKVENMLQRILENKDVKKLKLDVDLYSFIEYMAYRLKTYGKEAAPFLAILEEQVQKNGMTLSDVINKEHFDIALKRVSMQNSILSIKAISRMDILSIFENTSVVEKMLNTDKVYKKMDYKSKANYRNAIEEISKKTKLSEVYITQKCLELCNLKLNNNKNDTKDDENINQDVKKVTAIQDYATYFNQKNENNDNKYSVGLDGTKGYNRDTVNNQKKSHVGYYLIAEGKSQLLSKLLNRKVKNISNSTKAKLYVAGVYILTIAITILLCMKSWVLGLLCFIPIQNVVTKFLQYVLSKAVKPKILPKLDFQDNGIPKKYATMCVIPALLKDENDVTEFMHKLEVYYLANKSDNLYFTLLGDCTSEKSERKSLDEKIAETGRKCVKELNGKYGNIFNFIYRKREWSSSERCFMGWERKRGILTQLNEYLVTSKNPFWVNTCNDLPKIKYVITIDSDTSLSLNQAERLVGTIAHVLNKPEINKITNTVVSGHALIQPRIGIGIKDERKTIFSRLFAGSGGTDLYANAVSDVYQDNFDEGIYTGKGIYDVDVFYDVLKDTIPENSVLSHDLLEGNYLRCGLASDILLMDGYPSNYISYRKRKHRWIRGDVQIIPWLNSTLNTLSKYKILDNLARDLEDFFELIIIIVCFILALFNKANSGLFLTLAIIFLAFSSILELLDIFMNYRTEEQKLISKEFTKIQGSIYRFFIKLSILPDMAYLEINAFIKSLYRMKISHNFMLEWTTSNDAEKNSQKSVKGYYLSMIPNVVLGLLLIALAGGYLIFNFGAYFSAEGLILNESLLGQGLGLGFSIIFLSLGIIWLIAPLMMYKLSLKNEKQLAENISENDKEFLLDKARKTWQFFKDNMVNNLPSDNYQPDRKVKRAVITSPTNIGLALMSMVSAYDLKFESLEDTISMIEKTITTIENLPKWNGHLYNWYNIYTLEAVKPVFISSVDSGNLVGYLYTVKQFLMEIISKNFSMIGAKENISNINGKESTLIINKPKINVNISKDNKKTESKVDISKNINKEEINSLVKRIDTLIHQTDFSKLYDYKIGLFSIGYNLESNTLINSYYDLLASEARQTSIIAIAKRDVPSKHWNNCSRLLTTMGLYKGLISWGGTAFEYLMPTVNIPSYETSLLDESCRFSILSQKKYAKKLGIPWGISESAYNTKDFKGNYQYKTFGVPWLGLKRDLDDEIVISPYATAMALTFYPNEAIENLKTIDENSGTGKYGFYESIDYKPKRAVNKTFMAHHQGLILTSINNLLNNNIFQKRFMRNAEIEGAQILLEEKMPKDMITTKEKKEKVEKIKYKDYEEYTERTSGINVLANEKYSIVMKDDGSSYSKFGNDIISDNIHIYIKDINSRKIYDTVFETQIQDDNSQDKQGIDQTNRLKAANYTNNQVIFTTSEDKVIIQDGNLMLTMKVTIVPNLPIEIRKISIKNTGMSTLTLEVTSYMDILLADFRAFYSHPTFNKMFIDYEKIGDGILFTRRRREESRQKSFVATNLVYDEGDLEFELDKERFVERGNFETENRTLRRDYENKVDYEVQNSNLDIPSAVRNSSQLSKKIVQTIQPIVAMRRLVNVKPDEEESIYLINSAGDNKEEAIENLKEYTKSERLNAIFDISKNHSFAETRFLNVKGKDIALYQKMLEKLLFPKTKECNIEMDLSTRKLWKYGISGDNPILLVKLRDNNDTYLINEVTKAKEYFDMKNITVDVVILSKNEIQTKFKTLINIPLEDKRVIEARANLILDAKLGSIGIQMKEIETSETDRKNKLILEPGKSEKNIEINTSKLLFYNGYGGFSEDGNEYHIIVNKNKKTPVAWSNIMTNDKFGTLVTEGLGGYTWYKNCKTNRITEFSNDAQLDRPSELIIMQDISDSNDEKKEPRVLKNVFSISPNVLEDNGNYHITYGFGYSKFEHIYNDIEEELIIFVPKDDSLKINKISLKNTSLKKKKIKILYDVDFILGEVKNRFINYSFKENYNLLLVKNNINPSYYAYITSNEKIEYKNNLVEINVEIDSLETKEVTLILGAEETETKCMEIGSKYLGKEDEALEEVKKYWLEKVKVVQVKTPLKSFDIMQNGWTIYQTIASRKLSRTGFYQSGGAIGYRDQLQDSMGLKYLDSNILKNQIILHAKHQFKEGDVLHWWHNEKNTGIRARYSDDLLWLPYAVATYIEFTGDFRILNEEAGYVIGRKLKENEHDYMSEFKTTKETESIYEHCMRAINKSLNFEYFPKMNGGDWNDGMNKVGIKGKGESVWLGFFLYSILVKFAEYSKYITRFANKETAIAMQEANRKVDVKNIDTDEKSDEYERLMQVAEKLKKNLNTEGWDGRWYKRATDDEGRTLGSAVNKECKIDGISQSWAVISNAGDNDKKYIAMENMEKYLIDKENNLVKLLTPPFGNKEFKPGYIASYAPGMRENGGQYTHAAIWGAIAETILNKPEEAMEIYKMINPIEHSKTEEQMVKYKVEPYVIEADIYGENEFAGRGGWTWYTGSSGWLFTLQTEYILGLKIYHGELKIKPCVPKDWNEFEVDFKWKNAKYHIKYERKNSGIDNKDGKQEKNNNLNENKQILDLNNDNVQMYLNGEKVDEIKLKDEGEFEVKVEF